MGSIISNNSKKLKHKFTVFTLNKDKKKYNNKYGKKYTMHNPKIIKKRKEQEYPFNHKPVRIRYLNCPYKKPDIKYSYTYKGVPCGWEL